MLATHCGLDLVNPAPVAAPVVQDIYAFGLVLWEVLVWRLPWEAYTPQQIVVAVAKGRRPEVPAPADLPGGGFGGLNLYCALMRACWAQHPGDRPHASKVISTLR